MTRRPFYFGPANRPLFGWYHGPDGDARATEGVVICQPMGHEYMSAHRTMRHLADRLAVAGLPVIRFDYDGAGNSAGRDDDPNRVESWIESIKQAVAALRNRSECAHVSLVGLRLGATLAALASCDIGPSSLVLWAACDRGRTYVRELKALAVSGFSTQQEQPAPHLEAGGFVVTEDTQRALGAIDLLQVVPRAGRIFLVNRDDVRDNERLRETWKAAGLDVEHCSVAGYVDMMAAPHNTTVPVQALTTIVQWLASRSGSTSVPVCAKPVENTSVPLDVRESVVMFGERRATFGVLTEPGDAARCRGPMVVISNAGAAHHVGPGRLYVELTRRLARAGLRCFRFDLPGLGDSVLPSGERENESYPPNASDITASALDMLARDFGASSFVLTGLCSGAHASFHAALDLDDRPIVEAVLINPLTFYYKPGMPLDVPSTPPPVDRWKRYTESIRQLARRSDIARAMVNAGKVAFHWAWSWRSAQGASAVKSDLEEDLRRLMRNGRKVTFIFSRFDPGYDLLMAGARRTVHRSIKRGDMRLCSIRDANHTFDATGPRGEMMSWLERHLVDRIPTHVAAANTKLNAAQDRIRLLTFVTDFGCGGTERQVVNLGLALDTKRFAVEFGCLRQWGTLLPEITNAGFPLRDYPIRRLYGARAMRQQVRLARHLRRHRTQVLHSYNLYSNVFAIPAAWLAGVPVIIASIRDRGVYLTRAQRHVQRYVCRLADCILVNAESIKEWLIGDGYDPSKILVIRNGIDLTRLDAVGPAKVRGDLQIPADAPIVTMIARLNAKKGVEDFIDAADIVSRRFSNARFLIVGQAHVAAEGAPAEDLGYHATLQQRAARRGLTGKVILTGYRADVPALLAETTVSVLPSHSEGLSNTLLESMAAGVPVVATHVGGTPEIVEDGVTGLLVPPQQPELLADAIARVLADPELAMRLGAAGRQSTRDRFSLDRMVHATEQLYLDLLVRRAAEPGWRGRLGLARPAFDAVGKRP
jgi:glycosyltransferase involved in cell wall biosynthesis/pimeloyl-ACP methyl ester carboxylesterase